MPVTGEQGYNDAEEMARIGRRLRSGTSEDEILVALPVLLEDHSQWIKITAGIKAVATSLGNYTSAWQ